MDPSPPGARVAVLPQFLSPFRWLGLSEHEGEIHVSFFDVGPFATGGGEPRTPKRWSEVLPSLWEGYPPPDRAKISKYRRAADSPALEAVRRLPEWSVYLAFARFPLETVQPEPDGGATVIIQDLRFLPWFTGPWERGGEQGMRRQPFAAIVTTRVPWRMENMVKAGAEITILRSANDVFLASVRFAGPASP